MKTNQIIAVALITIGSVLSAGADVVVQVQLPFSDTFDNHAVRSYTGLVWSANDAFMPTVTNRPAPLVGSTNSLYSIDQVTLTIDDPVLINSNVWCSMYTRVTTHATPPPIDHEAAAFYIANDGKLYAIDDEGWVYQNRSIDTNAWIGVAVHLDYNTRRWNLYVSTNGTSVGTSMIKVNSMPLAFNADYLKVGTYEELAKIEISGQTYIDTFSTVRTAQAIVNGVPSPTNIASVNSIQFKLNDLLSGAALQFFGGTGYLHTEFGVALGNLMVSGDKISVYVSGSGWRIFEFNGATFDAQGVYTAADTPITMTTGLRFNLVDEAVRESSFFVAYNTPATPSTTTINPSWNLLAVPMTTNFSITAGLDNFGGFAPSPGDRITLRRNGQWVLLRCITINGEARWVRLGTKLATESFPAGSSFWYNRSANSVDWTF